VILPAPTDVPSLITRVLVPTPMLPQFKVNRPLTFVVPTPKVTAAAIVDLEIAVVVVTLAVCAAAPMYSTVKLVRVLVVIVYWLKKESAPVRVTRAVPVPVSVPAPLINRGRNGREDRISRR